MISINRILIPALTFLLLPIAARADLTLPVSNGVVTSGVGWRADPFGTGKLVLHRGTDIAVPVGTPVRATRAGRVVFTGIHGGHGNTVIIEHGNGVRSLYGHNDSLMVQPGDRITAGEVIALSGNSGRSTGPHVHYEVLSGVRHVVVAERSETAVEPRLAPGTARQLQDRKMEKIVDAILLKINSSPMFSGNGWQGG